jgi:hypothetical protein
VSVWNLKLGTWNLEPETWNLELEAWSPLDGWLLANHPLSLGINKN